MEHQSASSPPPPQEEPDPRDHIAVVGTFDVENYGDLLLAEVARHNLHPLGHRVLPISPVGGPPVWSDSTTSSPVDRLTSPDLRLAGIVVGGGNIIHARRSGLRRYATDPLGSLLAYSELWRIPGYLAQRTGIPLVWNAPGIPAKPDARVASVLERMASAAAYVSVRDAFSAENLRAAGFTGPIAIVPDPGVQATLLWPREELAQRHGQMLADAGMDRDQPTVAFSLNDRYVDAPPAEAARWIERAAHDVGGNPVLLATGPCHGDDRLVARVAAQMRTPTLALSSTKSLRDITAALAMADCFVGSSLHGVVVAAGFGNPSVVVGQPGSTIRRKAEGFCEQFGITGVFADSFSDCDAHIARTLSLRDRWATVADASSTVLTPHWSTIRASMADSGVVVGRGDDADHVQQAEDSLKVLAVNIDGLHESHQQTRAALSRARSDAQGSERTIEEQRVAIEEQCEASDTIDVELELLRARNSEIEPLRAELKEVKRDRQNAVQSLQDATQRHRQTATRYEEAKRKYEVLRSARSVRLALPIAEGLRRIASRVVSWQPSGTVAVPSRSTPMRPAVTTPVVDSGQTAELRRLRTQNRQLQEELQGLRARPSVRAALRAADVLRPGYLAVVNSDTYRRVRRPASRRGVPPTSPGQAGQPPHEVVQAIHGPHQFDSTDTGVFYDLIRTVHDQAGSPEFNRAWSESEGQLRATATGEEGGETRVSIVMPTWNRAHVIGQAIRSITDQTHRDWELLVCDDDSDDDTAAVVAAFDDDRISYQRLAKAGAAAARNVGLASATGTLVAYLDSDNLWHPRFLERHVATLQANPGRHASYSNYVDVVEQQQGYRIKRFTSPPFDYDRLATKNFIDLNSFVHRRAMFDLFGGFNEDLVRQQDWDLVLKYCFLREPIYLDTFLTLYRRNVAWGQITDLHRGNTSTVTKISEAVEDYYGGAMTPSSPSLDDATRAPRLSVISWDICRNHFSKAYNLAESFSDPSRVHLLGFQFFDEPIFGPYADAEPEFATTYLPGGKLSEWASSMAQGASAISNDIAYAVKPRLPSLGTALIANYHFGTPVVLEMNDLESVVTRPRAGQTAQVLDLDDVDPGDPDLGDPYGPTWTAIMEGLAPDIPIRVTHNHNLDSFFGGGAHVIRNPKDDQWFDPDRYDRDDVRRDLGFAPGDRVLLFGGMVRKHKGIFEFVELLERLGPQWRLLVVGSRETPDQRRLAEQAPQRVTIVPPVDRNEMAKLNLACDAVVLWLDPDVAASHYQMPYKLTDALAMKVPVIANDIGDLGDLGLRGHLRLVPYGDHDTLIESLSWVEDDTDGVTRMVESGRRLYLREFSYQAVRGNLALVMEQAATRRQTMPVSVRFAEFFARVRQAQGVDLGGRS